MFKETYAGGHQRVVPLKVVILPLLTSLAWKQLQIGTDVLLITTSTSDELFSCINNFIIIVLLFFAIFGYGAQFKSELW